MCQPIPFATIEPIKVRPIETPVEAMFAVTESAEAVAEWVNRILNADFRSTLRRAEVIGGSVWMVTAESNRFVQVHFRWVVREGNEFRTYDRDAFDKCFTVEQED